MRNKRTSSARQPSSGKPGLSPGERRLRAQLAAHAMHATHDSRQTSAPGRAAFLARFEAEVDPEGTLAPEERARRAEHARKAHYTRLAFESAKARRAKRAAKAAEAAADPTPAPAPEGGEAA
jgi:hypothetical protein